MGAPTLALLCALLLASAKSQFSNIFSIPQSILDVAIRVNSASDHTGNFVFSPLSISTALNLLLMGADGLTKQQLQEFLTYSPEVPEDRIHDAYGSILGTFNAKSNVEVRVANAVITQKGLGLEKRYSESAMKYKTQTGTLDFQNNPEQALLRINEWVANQTNNKITKLFSQPPSPSTKMLVLTAVYFKGAWETPFPEQQTRKGDFFVAPGRPVTVDYMANVITVPYADSKNLDCKAIVLPYKGLEYGMLFLLPNSDSPQAVQDLENRMTAQEIDSLMTNDMIFKLTTVHIPKFKIKRSFSLRQTLMKAGVSAIFSPDANLNKITREPAQVDDVLHQAYIEVTEDGTEAAAATGISLSRDAPSKNFIANKPFVFIIRHNKLDISLFHGRVIKPEF